VQSDRRPDCIDVVLANAVTAKDIGIPDTRPPVRSHSLSGYRVGAAVPPFEPCLLLGCARGKRRGLKFDHELPMQGRCFTTWASLLPTAAPTSASRSTANVVHAVRVSVVSSHGIGQDDIDTVWTAIALHTTPASPQHMHPVVRSGDGRRRDGRAGADLWQIQRRLNVKRSCTRTHAPSYSRKTSSRRSTMGIKHKHDIRQRQGRRARGQGPGFQARQFLQRDSRIGLERLTGRARSAWPGG